jgi:hypothetical protein
LQFSFCLGECKKTFFVWKNTILKEVIRINEFICEDFYVKTSNMITIINLQTWKIKQSFINSGQAWRLGFTCKCKYQNEY